MIDYHVRAQIFTYSKIGTTSPAAFPVGVEGQEEVPPSREGEVEVEERGDEKHVGSIRAPEPPTHDRSPVCMRVCACVCARM